MGLTHVGHSEIRSFAVDKVNLPVEKASKYREQAKGLQDRLQNYLDDHEDFSLRRMVLSGSLAKGTALKSLNDIDVGCYITGVDESTDTTDLINFLVEKLGKAYPNFSQDQITPQTYCVTVSFKGSGLDVDIVPILYNGDPQWKGKLVSQRDGTLLDTSVPMHLQFIKKRKSEHKIHFAQVVRLVKFWIKQRKSEDEDFRFKSFMAELILATLADDGCDFTDYPEALQSFFSYVASSNLKEVIAFSDYYSIDRIPKCDDRVKVFDPVNSENNAAKRYGFLEAQKIIDAAIDAGDAIDAAMYATTKEKTIYYWQKVFGPTFSA